MTHFDPTRRRVLAGAGAALALGPLNVRAQAFPSKNMRVVIPTGQGGGAERLARAFDGFWGSMLKTNFEYNFFPGAAGQVGYEVFVNKREKDGYNLLFGNMGPEMIMYALQKPNYRFPEDFQYFCRTDIDDSVVFALRKGKFQRVEDVVAEAKKRPVNVAVSRLPHPASIGMLALGAALGVVAVMVRQEIVLVVMGGVFVLETVSVILQVASYKLTGKRIFRMAPIHHHFELIGWRESKIVVRFMIAAIIFALLSLSTLKLR
jgi:hypothetical protein